MSDNANSDTEFREEIRQVLRRHDPGADDLRALSNDLEQLAERYEAMEGAL